MKKSTYIVSLALVLFCAARPAMAVEAENRRIVLEFYQQAIVERDFDRARLYLKDDYIEHNPLLIDGPEGLRGLLEMMKKNRPNARVEIKRVLTDGNFVVLHVLSVPDPSSRGRAIVEIFRLEGGKIAEHWDVIQQIPEQSANPNSMF